VAQFNHPDALELFRATGQTEDHRQQPPVLRKPAHASALGKVLLAWADSSVVDHFIGLRKLLPPYTEFTVVRPDQFRAHLAQVRR